MLNAMRAARGPLAVMQRLASAAPIGQRTRLMMAPRWLLRDGRRCRDGAQRFACPESVRSDASVAPASGRLLHRPSESIDRTRWAMCVGIVTFANTTRLGGEPDLVTIGVTAL